MTSPSAKDYREMADSLLSLVGGLEGCDCQTCAPYVKIKTALLSAAEMVERMDDIEKRLRMWAAWNVGERQAGKPPSHLNPWTVLSWMGIEAPKVEDVQAHDVRVVAMFTKTLEQDAALAAKDTALAEAREALAKFEARVNEVCLHLDERTLIETLAVRRRQRDGSSLWRVKRLPCVLNRDGEWEYEPIPSSRDDDFVRRCSFDSLAAAIAAFHALPQEPSK